MCFVAPGRPSLMGDCLKDGKVSTSRLQRQAKDELTKHFGHYHIEENAYPHWLTSPTGNRLELDLYIPQLGVAIEVQGRQHIQFEKFFHKDQAGFMRQMLYDQIKRIRCQKHSVRLFEVYSYQDIQRAIASIYTRLNKHVSNDDTESRNAALRMLWAFSTRTTKKYNHNQIMKAVGSLQRTMRRRIQNGANLTKALTAGQYEQLLKQAKKAGSGAYLVERCKNELRFDLLEQTLSLILKFEYDHRIGFFALKED